jgi:hypothetical protein
MVAQPNYGLSTDTTLGGNSPSDIISPSEKAIKTYVDNHVGGGSLADLSDVSVSTATSGQVLGYDGTNWVNTNKTLVVMRDWSVS